jgi:alpha-galactosidase
MTSHLLRRTALLAVAAAAGLLAVPPAADAACRPAPHSAVADTGADQGAPTYHSSGLAPTPYMGWNTYYGLGAGSESEVKSVAGFLVSSGMRDAGYRYVWLDGGWQATPPRDAHGNLAADPTRPGTRTAFPPSSPTCTGSA